MSQILIALEWLPAYRVDFLGAVAEMLEKAGHSVDVIHGDPPQSVAKRGTSASASYATYRRNRTLRLGKLDVVSQPVLRRAHSADFVIVQQEASLLLNLLLATGAVRPSQGWGMWGHGKHFNEHDANPYAERIKAWETRRCDWFFAYTELSKRAVIEVGVDPGSITVVRNTTGTPDESQASADARSLAHDLADHRGSVVALVSSLDQWKRLDFLTEAMEVAHELMPEMVFLVVGEGEGFPKIKEWAQGRPWVRLAGKQFGADKAAIVGHASLTVHPGLAGLHVVDSFRHKAPMVTTELEYHSHEFDYLVDDVNGRVLPAATTAAEYGETVVELLRDPETLARLSAGCDAELADLTVEASATRFVDGVVSALGRQGYNA